VYHNSLVVLCRNTAQDGRNLCGIGTWFPQVQAIHAGIQEP
jgi:hypothetical protein